VTSGSGFFGKEQGAKTLFMPYDKFESMASLNEMICLSSIQCGEYEHFKSFCQQTIGDAKLSMMSQAFK
jgi:hypothetical protein